MWNGKTTLENSLKVPWKVKYTPTICPSHFTPRYLPKRSENINPYKDLTVNVHSSSNRNHPNLESSSDVHQQEDGCYISLYHARFLNRAGKKFLFHEEAPLYYLFYGNILSMQSNSNCFLQIIYRNNIGKRIWSRPELMLTVYHGFIGNITWIS